VLLIKKQINILFGCLLIFSLCGYGQAQTLSSAPSVKPFYFAVSAMVSPARTLANFSELETYLAAKLSRPVKLKQRRTYAEINELLAQSRIQMAFTCTGGYISGRRDFGLELLAVPVINGSSSYRSYIVVRKESSAKSLADLRGKVFAYADPLSLSGYIYPTARIKQLGYSRETFFRHDFFTESHDKSIEAVAIGLADGAAVDSLIFDALRQAKAPNAMKLKVIEKSAEFGMPPVVVAPDIDHELRYKLLKVMLNMDKDASGREVLRKLRMDRFILPDPALYRSAFLLNKELE